MPNRLRSGRGRGLPIARLFILALLFDAASGASAQAQAADPPLKRLTLEDLLADENVVDADISPSGKTIVAVVRNATTDALILLDLASGEKKKITQINKDHFNKQTDVRIGFVLWKTDDRLLFQVRSAPNEGLNWRKMSRSALFKLGNRLFAVDRDGKNLTPMFNEQWNDALVGAFDTSDIASMLWKDPNHILIRVGGWEGRSLFKVDVTTGRGKVVERQKDSVIDWWLDVDGTAMVRVEYSVGTLRFYRKLQDGSWKKYYSIRRNRFDELPDLQLIGPSSDPNQFYVRARKADRDRVGIYLYDLQKESFGDPLVENPVYDIDAARIAVDGSKIVYHCYDEHVRICEFADPKRNAYMRGLRKFFEGSANVNIIDASEDGKVILLSVDGPVDAPAFYYYLVDQKQIKMLGFRQGTVSDKILATSVVRKFKARDGMELWGYLTFPPGATDAKGLPLVLMPHGGPEARDRLGFNPWVQYLAARGYAVFQPNFRGSGGFGQAFAATGYGEWGRKMQDDLGDGVKMLADEGVIDPKKVCIFGASYGGYAALAGATLTPDAYQCAASLAGISNLLELTRAEKKKYGADSETYAYVVKAVGDPDKDPAALLAVSPASHVKAVKIPILLIHGEDDEVVPISQSEDMQKLLEKAGRKSEFLRLEREGHGGYARSTSKVMFSTIGWFLWENLGPGFGVEEPPVRYTFQ